MAWTLQRPGVTSIVIDQKTVTQLTDQLAALDVHPDDDLLSAIDEVLRPGGVAVPYYLDDSFAYLRPHPSHW